MIAKLKCKIDGGMTSQKPGWVETFCQANITDKEPFMTYIFEK